MLSSRGGVCRTLAFAGWAFLAAPALAQSRDGKPDVFEKVDPYTRGEREALDRAGYVSLGPFDWAQGIRTEDVRETLGGIDVLWVETVHFKIGSTLETYKLPGDPREDDRIEAELARLKKKLAHYRDPGNELDPWIRVHLFAMRLEDLYASFLSTFGLAEKDFPDGRKEPDADAVFMGEGPYLGQPRKFAVLLTEKTSSLGRFVKRYADREPLPWDRFPMEGGTVMLAVSAEGLRTHGYELETGLACAVAGEITHNFLDGFRNAWSATPLWFRFGLGHAAARAVDERFCPGAEWTSLHENLWKWEPRVRGLVQNKVAVPWTTMAAWEKWEDLKTQGHLLAWSRASWLLTRKPAELRTFLMALTEPQAEATEVDGAKRALERQEAAAKAAFGKGLADLDAEWQKFVKKKYAAD